MARLQSDWRSPYDSDRHGHYRSEMRLNASSSPSIYASHESMFDDDGFITKPRPLLDTQAREIIQRKISKQKRAAEQRTEHSDGSRIFDPTQPYTLNSASSSLQNLHRRQRSPFARSPAASHSFPAELYTALRHSASSRLLHGASDVILSNGVDHQTFHQPQTRKITKITPKNRSLSNNRGAQPRSASANSVPTKKHEAPPPPPPQNEAKRLKSVRRHEPAHVTLGPRPKTSLINTDSWKTDPVNQKKLAKKELTDEPATTTDASAPAIEQSTEPKQPKPKKPKRDKSATKPPATTYRPPPRPQPPPKPEKTEEEKKQEKKKLKKYIEKKKHEYEQKISNEKKLKKIQDKERKERLTKLNEQIKKVAQQPLPPALTKKSSTSAASQLKDPKDQTRDRMLQLLGPKPNFEPPIESHRDVATNEPPVLERSRSSSSSSSSESVVDIPPPKLNDQTVSRSRSEPPALTTVSNSLEHRNQNLLRWAHNLTRDCSDIENKFKYLRPDGTQQFDIVPPSRQQLQQDNGNLRIQPPIIITNGSKTDREPTIPSKILRPSGRLSRLNQNHTSEFQDQQLPGIGNLRDPILQQRIKRDRAAAKIQATYRGYTVRKALQWSNGKQQRLSSEFNRRPAHKPTKTSSYRTDPLDAPGAHLDLRFSDDNFTIGSTLLRHYQGNGTNILPTKDHSISEKSRRQKSLASPSPKPSPRVQKPSSVRTYSDDYENMTSTVSSAPASPRPTPQKPRVIQQPIHSAESVTSSSSDSSSSATPSSNTPSRTPEPRIPSAARDRRSVSPPLQPPISPDNGRPVHYHHPAQTRPPPTSTSHRILDERRYSPDALERQLNAELHLLDGVEASMTQVENMERLRSVALAQQEVVSLAQVLKNQPVPNATAPKQHVQKSPAQQSSSSSTPSTSSASNRRRRSPSPQQRPTTSKASRQRPPQSSTSPSSSSSEAVLSAREKRVRQKFPNETDAQAYEKRLNDIEKTLRVLEKRDNDDEDVDHKRLESALNALDLSGAKRTATSSNAKPRSSNDSSISEDIPVSPKSVSSISTTIQRKTNQDTSEIRTEPIRRDSDTSSISFHQQQSDTVTTDVSDIERRVRTYEEQVNAKKTELDRLQQKKRKEALRRQEDELKKQLQTYNHEIETVRREPPPPKVQQQQPNVSAGARKAPSRSSSDSSSSSTSTATKPQESSIAEDLPVTTTTASQSKTDLVEKRAEPSRPAPKKERDFFDDDDDDDDEDEQDKEKEPEVKPMETPREERDTQHDALSLSIATDLAALSETDNDDSQRPSTDNERSVLNLNTNPPAPPKVQADSESSSSTTTTASETASKKQVESRSLERKASPINNDYDEDFSDVSHLPATPTKEPLPETKVVDVDNESIQEDFEERQSIHGSNLSLSSKSSGDEQSEILVLVKKSANTTPRRQDDKTIEDEPPPPPIVSPRPPPTPELRPKVEPLNNDDTSHDISEDEETNDQEDQVDKLTDLFFRVLIDEAIAEGKQVARLKKEVYQNRETIVEQPPSIVAFAVPEPRGWLPDDEIAENNNQEQNVEINEFILDLSQLDEKNPNEPRVESPRKIIVEEPVPILVPHTREQVNQLCHQAIDILFEQNADFSDRSAVQCVVPVEYLTSNQQDSDNEHTRLNRRAYCRMIFDLCVELLNEMYTENVTPSKHPEWQQAKLASKRFYRGRKPDNRRDVEQLVQAKVLEILAVNPRPITYSKWRVSNARLNSVDKYETVLEEEIRRTESQWITYDDECTQMKFDIADLILNQLVQESITECLSVIERRLSLSSNSTRL